MAHGNSVEKREKGTFGGLLSSISVFHFYLSVALKLSKEGKNPPRTVCKGKCICYVALTNIAFITLIFPLFGDLSTWIKDIADRTTSLTTCSSLLTGRSAEQ